MYNNTRTPAANTHNHEVGEAMPLADALGKMNRNLTILKSNVSQCITSRCYNYAQRDVIVIQTLAETAHKTIIERKQK